MAQVLVNESSLEDIADAIRDKNGSSTTYQPAQMAAAIRSISTGVTGVKGNAENSYRTGDVNLTPANIGATPANIGAKATQSAVSSPSASGTAVAFIDTISQNAQGVITATKKTVKDATTSASGLMSAADKIKLNSLIVTKTNTVSERTIEAHGTGRVLLQKILTAGDYKLIAAIPELQYDTSDVSTPFLVIGAPCYYGTTLYIAIYNPSSASVTISGTVTCIWMLT